MPYLPHSLSLLQCHCIYSMAVTFSGQIEILTLAVELCQSPAGQPRGLVTGNMKGLVVTLFDLTLKPQVSRAESRVHELLQEEQGQEYNTAYSPDDQSPSRLISFSGFDNVRISIFFLDLGWKTMICA